MNTSKVLKWQFGNDKNGEVFRQLIFRESAIINLTFEVKICSSSGASSFIVHLKFPFFQFSTLLHFISSDNLHKIIQKTQAFQHFKLDLNHISSNHEASSILATFHDLCCHFWALLPPQRHSLALRTRFRLQILGSQSPQVLHGFFWG
jgi:hypothetical protein